MSSNTWTSKTFIPPALNTSAITRIMSDPTFPLDFYVTSLVQVFDAIHYQDNNYDGDERVKKLRDAHLETAKHFAHPPQQELLRLMKVGSTQLAGALRTAVIITTYGYPDVPLGPTVGLTIYLTYCIFLDDTGQDFQLEKTSFIENLIGGKPQSDPWWQLMIAHLPNFIKFYGEFCTLNIVRSTMDCEWFYESMA